MHEGGALSWREVVERHHARLIDDLSMHIDSALEAAAARASAGERARTRSDVESLNQVLRRLRAADAGQVLAILAEGCAACAEKLAVLVFDNHQAQVAVGVGIAGQGIRFDTVRAPAVVSAVESRDPVVALATSGEISSELARAFAVDGADTAAGSVVRNEESAQGGGAVVQDVPRAYLFPVVSRHTEVAMLVASQGASMPAASAQIELLCEATGLRLDVAAQAVKAGPEKTDPAGTNDAPVSSPAWEGLTADDQKLHLQGQRMARLRAAEMRLANSGELRIGTASGDIYTALRKPIDAARLEFREKFLAQSPTMVDYLHLEILRSLAGDDERLLGPGYPGPMRAGRMPQGQGQPEPIHA